MPVAKAKILCSNTTLFPWKIINIEEKLIIQGLFEYIFDQYIPWLKKEILLEKIEACFSNFDNLFTFQIKIFSNENNSQPVNIFDVLRSATRELRLPTFSFSQNLKTNDKLKLDILFYISSHKGGWTYDVIPIRKKFIKELSDALYQNLMAYLEMSWINYPCFNFLKSSLVKFANENVDPYYPHKQTAKSTYLQMLEEAFIFKVGMYTYYHGNVINITFI
ncbi:hypothetical protein GLOIN_2v1718314 [Rhizophagus clarus]|uniref:Uncharacterized protein n=1 Tax=Rhizophagus clarus TaxID=94130 RepID=A0A8H3KWQ2_9GLOM|nr:hypothetical protein GLOIN_2v1718314 [Rhizophagus clarus]